MSETGDTTPERAKTLPDFVPHIGVTADEYRKLCLRAFENLPTDTTVTVDDVDSILTWCLPEYARLRGTHAGDPADVGDHTNSYALLHGHSGPYTREEMTAAFRAGYLAASPPGFAQAAEEEVRER